MSQIHDVGKIIAQARELARAYKQLTGKPLGITGEIAEYEAARLLGLALADARTPGYDALRGAERLQIKSRVVMGANRSKALGAIKLKHEWDAVLMVLMDESFTVVEIWEAGRPAVTEALKVPGSKRREEGALPISQFKKLGKKVWPVT